MQKKAIRIVCKKSYRAHAQPLFLACNVLPLNQLIAFNCLRLMYDFANKILPPSFDNTWIRNSETEGYNLRNGDDFQMVLSDTPGIIKPAYELQNSMMDFVKSAFEDADVLIYMVEIGEKALKDASLKTSKENTIELVIEDF